MSMQAAGTHFPQLQLPPTVNRGGRPTGARDGAPRKGWTTDRKAKYQETIDRRGGRLEGETDGDFALRKLAERKRKNNEFQQEKRRKMKELEQAQQQESNQSTSPSSLSSSSSVSSSTSLNQAHEGFSTRQYKGAKDGNLDRDDKARDRMWAGAGRDVFEYLKYMFPNVSEQVGTN